MTGSDYICGRSKQIRQVCATPELCRTECVRAKGDGNYHAAQVQHRNMLIAQEAVRKAAVQIECIDRDLMLEIMQ